MRDNARNMLTPRGIFATGLLAIGIPAALFGVELPFHVNAPIVVRPTAHVFVRAEEPGRLARVLAEENRTVRAGEVVGELESPSLRIALEEATFDRDVVRFRLALLERGTRPEEIARRMALFEAANAKSRHLAVEEVRDAMLASGGTRSMLEHARSMAQAGVASAERDAAAADLALARAGARKEEIERAREELEAASRRVDGLELRKSRLVLRAPVDGVVLTRKPQELEGVRLEIGQTFIEILDTHELRAEILVPAYEPIGHIQKGARVVVRLNAWPHDPIETKVAMIANRENEQEIPIYSQPLSLPAAIAETSGWARIYGQPCTIGYRWFYIPIARLVRYDLWSLE